MNTIDYKVIADELGPEIANALRLLAAQRAKGIPKYGYGVEGNTSLSARDWLQHAREELADGLVYLQRLDRMHEDELRECRTGTVFGLLFELRVLIESLEANSDDFKLLAIQQWINSYKSFQPKHVELNVQPSVLDAYINGQDNLLTLSRTSSFPFTQKVQVML